MPESRARARRSAVSPPAGRVDPKREAGKAECGCGVHAEASHPRQAVAVDPDLKSRNLTRLRRIEGQIRGLQKMVDTDRYCADILVQIASVQEALRSVSQALMRNHLKHCASSAIRSSAEDAEGMYDELLALIYKYNR